MKKINIYINGEKKLVNINSTLDSILILLKVDLKSIAIEKNQKVVPKSLYNSTALQSGDKIEIVQFIGGG